MALDEQIEWNEYGQEDGRLSEKLAQHLGHTVAIASGRLELREWFHRVGRHWLDQDDATPLRRRFQSLSGDVDTCPAKLRQDH